MRQFLLRTGTRLRATWPTWGALLLITALACQPLLGLPPRGHDALLHYFRIPAVSELWQNGILFSRWLPDLIYGYGSPLFNFYPPLSAYLLTALYWLVGQNGLLAYSLSYAVALAITVAAMFLLGRHLFGSMGGLLASAAYTLSPHVLLQTYSRGSLSNALALAFAPLALFALLRVSRRATRPSLAFAALAVALVLLSHAAAGLLFVPVFVVVALAASRGLYRSSPVPVLAALALGAMLAAFAWAPGLVELDATRYAQSVSGGGAQFADHFAAALFWPGQTIARLAKTPLPHSPGLTQLLLGTFTILLGPLLARRWPGEPGQRGGYFVAFIALLGLGVLFFATPAATWFWQNLAPLRQLQFPWRLLDVPVLLLALAAAWWVTALRRRWQPWLLGAALVLIFLNAVPYLYPARMATLPAQPTLADATRVQQGRGIIGLTAWGEYSSVQVEEWPGKPPFPGADRGAALVEKLRLPQNVDLRAAHGGLLYATWELSLPTPAALSLSVHYFPGWQALVDGERAPLMTDEQGRMQVRLPAGLHELRLKWSRTPVRWLADGLSLVALVTTGWLLLPRGMKVTGVPPASTVRRKRRAAPWLVLLLGGLLLAKVALFDATSTPLVVHPDAQHIPGVARPPHGDFGVFRLLGYELQEADKLVLYWYAPQQVTGAYTVRVTMNDGRGVPVQEIENPYPGDNPTGGWSPGLLVRDAYRLDIDALEAPAAYQLSVAVLDPQSGEPLAVLDGPPGATSAGVGATKRAPEAALSLAPSLEANFAGSIALTNVLMPDSIRRGEALPLALYWQSLAPVQKDYTAYIHLVRPDGEFVAAYDAPPLDGVYPTSFWAPGERIVDERRIDLDVAPGDYLVRVGLYDLQSGERLPLQAPHAGADGLVVGALQVRP